MLKGIYRCFGRFRIFCNTFAVKFLLKLYRAEFSSLRSVGRPRLTVRKGGRVTIGKNFKMNNCFYGNPLSVTPCAIYVGENATLEIGENVGISSSFITAWESVKIGNNVKIGGGCYIIDTDFHSLHPKYRANPETDIAATAAVEIGDNVFIGATSIVLKGSKIGRNSVVGAGSVVNGEIPENEIWAGNPARLVKKLTKWQ
ncbi:MAG: acyltransferase [Bacteroidales bacterium]|nr:acyltransferase [Bacteroidales bacterium]